MPTPLSDLRSQSREDRGERCLENTKSEPTAELIEAGDALNIDPTLMQIPDDTFPFYIDQRATC